MSYTHIIIAVAIWKRCGVSMICILSNHHILSTYFSAIQLVQVRSGKIPIICFNHTILLTEGTIVKRS